MFTLLIFLKIFTCDVDSNKLCYLWNSGLFFFLFVIVYLCDCRVGKQKLTVKYYLLIYCSVLSFQKVYHFSVSGKRFIVC